MDVEQYENLPKVNQQAKQLLFFLLVQILQALYQQYLLLYKNQLHLLIANVNFEYFL